MTAPTEDPSKGNENAGAGAGDQVPDANPATPPAAPPTVLMDAADAGDEAALKLLTVLIDRDAHTRIPAKVLGFEVPIMLEIYGEDSVFVIDEEDFDAADFDVEAAYDNLRNKYRKFEPQLKQVYRSLGAFAKAVGVRAPVTPGVSPNRDKQSSAKVHKPAAKKAAAKR